MRFVKFDNHIINADMVRSIKVEGAPDRVCKVMIDFSDSGHLFFTMKEEPSSLALAQRMTLELNGA